MKNAATLKSNNVNTPKTPGGISKSLLTPCRRVGLSRNWKKAGPSPFISPLASNSSEVKEEKKETRKRKERVLDENIEQTDSVDEETSNSTDIDKTPSRNVEVPRKKKSKTLISAINKSQEEITSVPEDIHENIPKEPNVDEPCIDNVENIEVVSTPVRTKSKKSKRISPRKASPKKVIIESKDKPTESDISTVSQSKQDEPVYTIKEKSPNDLKKECVVVIQRKIFKTTKIINEINYKDENKKEVVDSDSDEAPLINIQKQNSIKTVIDNDDDDDFIDNKTKSKQNKLSTKSPKNKIKPKHKAKVDKVTEQKQSSQNCFDDDDDDDDFDNRRTILIKKTYEKVSKLAKAKSTGSITQKDIDNLRKRIESKKKLLLAQSVTPDTEELRNLIKKWQKGCQDALMELMDLMRNKFPDKQNMDYSEMLETLKIPPSLVGYDSDNDCFNSPDDASIILGEYKNL